MTEGGGGGGEKGEGTQREEKHVNDTTKKRDVSTSSKY